MEFIKTEGYFLKKRFLGYLALPFCMFFYPRQFFCQECFKSCTERIGHYRDSLAKTSSDSPYSSDLNAKLIKDLIGCKFPLVPLKTVLDETFTIEKFKNKVVFIHFWFATCPPCTAEIPVINRLVKKYKGSVYFLSISVDDKETLMKFLNANAYNSEHAYIPKEVAAKLLCVVGGYPMNIVIDKNLTVKDVWAGGSVHSSYQKSFSKKLTSAINLALKTGK